MKHLGIILAFFAKKGALKYREMIGKSLLFHLRLSEDTKTMLNFTLTLRYLLARRAIQNRELTKNQILDFLVGNLEKVQKKDHISIILDCIGMVIKLNHSARLRAHKLNLCSKINQYFDEFPTYVSSIINYQSIVGFLPVELYQFFLDKFRNKRSIFALKCCCYLLRALCPE